MILDLFVCLKFVHSLGAFVPLFVDSGLFICGLYIVDMFVRGLFLLVIMIVVRF